MAFAVIPATAHAQSARILGNEGDIFVNGRGATQDTIDVSMRVRSASVVVTISDSAGVLDDDQTCRRLTSIAVRCVDPRMFAIYAGKGADRVRIDAGARVRETAVIRGGRGDDLIVGGSLFDLIAAGRGDDLVKAGANRDSVAGNSGRDSLFGGRGDDRLRSADGARDRIIDCGRGGGDVADRDGLDPRPRSC
jgi:Ca2+-binding RTX toxin-like protein